MIQTGGKVIACSTHECRRKLIRLTLAGGAVFWVTSIMTSLLPVAADYRAALSNWSMRTVWIASLFAGLLIGDGVSYLFLRQYGKIPAKGPVMKSVLVSLFALIVFTIVIDVPVSFQGQGNSLHCFLIGFMFNLARFLSLGIAIGFRHKRLHIKVSE